MRTALTFVSLLAAFFVLAPQERLDAQVTTATFLGLVHDSSGAVVPGATVVATNRGTGVPREALTDARGEFVLSALPNGPYSIRIEMPGFKTYANEGIVLGAGQTVRQTFVLELGAVAETVTVAGVAPLIATGCSYLNPAAFAAVPVVPATNATVRAGTYKVGDARSPAEWDMNATFAKNFLLGGDQRLQVRADFFSVFNKKNWGSPSSAINASDFGRITSASGSRSMQIGARLSF